MSSRRRKEKLEVLLAQRHGGGRRRLARGRHDSAQRARMWMLLLAAGAFIAGILGVLHEFM